MLYGIHHDHIAGSHQDVSETASPTFAGLYVDDYYADEFLFQSDAGVYDFITDTPSSDITLDFSATTVAGVLNWYANYMPDRYDLEYNTGGGTGHTGDVIFNFVNNLILNGDFNVAGDIWTSGDIDSDGTIACGSVTDKLTLSHDGLNAYMEWDDGILNLQTTETDKNSLISIKGDGAGFGGMLVHDEDDAEYFQMYCSGGYGHISVEGTSPNDLLFNNSARSDVVLFAGAASTETRELKVSGYRSGDELRSLEIGVGVDAADTASFDGLSNYWFNGRIEAVGEVDIGGNLNHDGANVGFYGTAPIAQAVLATGAGATVDNVITALQNLGLVKQA